MFRDFVFAGGSGSNVQGENNLNLTISDLVAGQEYAIALYSYDSASLGNSMNWTATAPTTSNGLDGWWAATPAGNNTFTAPADQITLSFASGPPAAAIFDLTASAGGTISVWGYGGTGSGRERSKHLPRRLPVRGRSGACFSRTDRHDGAWPSGPSPSLESLNDCFAGLIR